MAAQVHDCPVLVFDKSGIYSVKAIRVGTHFMDVGVSADRDAGLLRDTDKSDAHLLFSSMTDYEHIYGDSGNVNRGFETVQLLEGKVDNTEGRESVVVLALNCRTGTIFKERADKNGNFRLSVNEFVDSTVFNIDAFDNLDKRRKYDLSLIESPVPNIPMPKTDSPLDKTVAYSSFDTARILKNIEVTARKREAMNTFRIEPTKAFYAGDPAIYRHANLKSLLRAMGVYNLAYTTVVIDNMVVQRSSEEESEELLININDIWQVEYIKNDPRTMMFQSGQNALPVLLIYTKYGNGGREAMGRPLANSFAPMGYVPNEVNTAERNSGDLILWNPELMVKAGDIIKLPLEDDGSNSGVVVSIKGLTTDGDMIEYCYLIF